MLLLKNISKSYKFKDFIEIALDNINLELPATGMIFIAGKSGSGKSTLLNIIGGIDYPDSGEIYFRNQPLDFSKRRVAENFRRDEVSFIFQKSNLMLDQTVYDNIAIAGELRGEKANPEQINKILESSIGLKGFALKKAYELTRSQSLKVAIARALYKNARIILADEPTKNLNSKDAHAVLELLKQEAKERLVIVASEDLEASKVYGDRIIELKAGKISQDQTIEKNFENINFDTKPSEKRISLLFLLKTAFRFLSERKIISLLTLFLSLLAVITFSIGFVSVITNPIDKALKSLKENNIHYAYLENSGGTKYIEGKYSGDEFAPLYKTYYDPYNKDLFRLPLVRYTAEIPDFEKFGLDLIYGNFPKTYTEIAITNYIAEKVITENSEFSSIGELIGKTSVFSIAGLENYPKLKITGIVKTEYEYNSEEDEVTGDYLYPHYYVKRGFMEHYQKDIVYGEGGFTLKYGEIEASSFFFPDNYKRPMITTVKNPLLSEDDVKIFTREGFVQAKDLLLADDEIIINLNYYNYLFREEGDYLTPENIEDLTPIFEQTIEFHYYDRYILGSPYDTYSVKIKGLSFDYTNEPMTAENSEYNYAALCVIVSDVFLNSYLKQYKSPVKYLVDLSAPHIKKIFKEHYPVANSISSADNIRTPLNYELEYLIADLDEVKSIYLPIGLIFAILTILLIYYNIKKNVDKNKNNISILLSLGAGKRHIVFMFILETIISIIFILPLTYISLSFFMKELNFKYKGINLKILNFDIVNVAIIITYTIFVYLCPIIIALRHLLRKTPTEIIR
ncbi:MAG: ATP-binding cassette domain-containing protein [Bacilli bacterium]